MKIFEWTLVTGAMVLIPVLSGCYRHRIELVDASVQKPGNVALFFSLDDKKGNPVPGLAASQFEIYEDDRLISTHESKQTILNPEISTERYTLLLLDMSGSVVEAGQVPLIQEAVEAFVDDIPENEKIAIYAFDGREEIVPIAEFGAKSAVLARKNELLTRWESKDPSTNLHGAIIQSLDVMAAAKSRSKVPLRFGTLVVFTDGTDRAHRASAQDAGDRIRESGDTVFVIGLGGETSEEEIKRFGKDGHVYVEDKAGIVKAFEDIAARVNAQSQRYYLLSYCSPARAGTHALRVVAQTEDGKGRLEYEFDATGFGPDCDPETTPAFKFPESPDGGAAVPAARTGKAGKPRTEASAGKKTAPPAP